MMVDTMIYVSDGWKLCGDNRAPTHVISNEARNGDLLGIFHNGLDVYDFPELLINSTVSEYVRMWIETNRPTLMKAAMGPCAFTFPAVSPEEIHLLHVPWDDEDAMDTSE